MCLLSATQKLHISENGTKDKLIILVINQDLNPIQTN